MADVELLPLPELPRQVEGYNSDYWEAGQIEEYAADYARACVEANIAALQAEIEALRAEVERLRDDGASAVRWAPGSAYWSEVLEELFGPGARKGIDVLESRWRKELERADTTEVLLRQALEALGRAHQTAMEQTLKARIPECAEFAGIAQDLDFVVTALRERLGVKA